MTAPHRPLVADPGRIRLAMLGMVDGNGHPYSWSAIINGCYDAEAMADCGFPTIPQYLAAAPPGALGIAGARVSHVWCDDPADAKRVARAAHIDYIVDSPEDVLGEVDAVIIATDKGWEHVERARPFVEAGLPVFVDKPLCDRAEDLRQFVAWHRAGRAILSGSALRYAREYAAAAARLAEIGPLRLLTMTTPKSWERYGIHALEGVYPLLRPGGWQSVSNSGDQQSNIVHVRHADGVEVVLAAIADLYGAFGCLGVYGVKGNTVERFHDALYAFRAQLVAVVRWLQTGRPPFAFDETIEMMKIVIAAIRSRAEGGRRVPLAEIDVD